MSRRLIQRSADRDAEGSGKRADQYMRVAGVKRGTVRRGGDRRGVWTGAVGQLLR